jgi:tyrosyl-tRNA synthetase
MPSDLDVRMVEAAEVSDSGGIGGQLPLINIMMNLKIFPSRGEAKRVMQQGGVYLDGQRIDDINFRLDIQAEREHNLKIGKKKFYKFIIR